MEDSVSTQSEHKMNTGGRGGNIVVPSPVDTVRYRIRNWFFTWNNYSEEDVNTIHSYLEKYAKKYMFQEETGEEGTPHLQGFFMLRSAAENVVLFKKFPGVFLRKLKSEEGSKIYCSKEETRTGRQWSGGYIKVRDPIEELKVWQREIIDEIEQEPEDRKIIWRWEKRGRTGKTSLAKHICLKYDGAIYVSGKAADIKCAIQKMIEAEKEPKIIIFDVPRTSLDYVSYQAIEEVKNGIFFSGKYESGMVMFNPPHVIVFANRPPYLAKLSLDRWDVKRIRKRDC